MNEAGTLNIKELVVSILRRWRMIVASTLILACLFGGYRFLSTFSETQDTEKIQKEIELYEQQQQLYDSRMELLNIELERNIAKTERYTKFSQLLEEEGIDLNRIIEVSNYYYLDTDYQIMPESSIQNLNPIEDIISSYIIAGEENSVVEAVESITGVASYDNLAFYYLKKESDSILKVSAIHTDAAKANEILDIVSNFILQSQSTISKNIAKHDITYINKTERLSSGNGILLELAESLESSNEANEKTLKTLSDLESLVPPTKPDYGMAYVLKRSIKYAIIGAMAGVFLSIVWALVLDMMDDKVRFRYDIRNQYSLNYLGTYIPK